MPEFEEVIKTLLKKSAAANDAMQAMNFANAALQAVEAFDKLDILLVAHPLRHG